MRVIAFSKSKSKIILPIYTVCNSNEMLTLKKNMLKSLSHTFSEVIVIFTSERLYSQYFHQLERHKTGFMDVLPFLR